MVFARRDKMIVVNMSLIDEESDKELFEKLFEKYKYRVYAIAFHILRSEGAAEDAASETFLYIARNFERIKTLEKKKQEQYIIIVSRNTAIDVQRREKRHTKTQKLPDELLSNDSLREYDDILLKNVIGELSDEDQEILYLRYSLELEHKTIAKSLGISVSAAQKRLQYAKEHLKKRLEGVYQ